jgi:alkanesulfonate monooxygenase SsuD/methylene tetrahydromethanopterin reductase-like flavin-dependent oxidoreductase (luciferase family)
MRFGLSGLHGGVEGPGPTSTLDLARLVESLGFDCMWFNEEHFGRGVPAARPPLSPVILATAVATATTTLRVGFSVLLAPLHQPLRLAEELATLDVLSAGRVNAGLSSGDGNRYRTAFGYQPGAVPGLPDVIDTMVGYWSGTPLCVEGTDCVVAPRPVQEPHPPIFVGAYRPGSLRWAASRGFAAIQHGIQSPASLHRCLGTYAEAGGDVSRVPVGRFCYVGESDATARAEAWPVVAAQARRLHQIGLWRRGDLIATEADLEPERFYRETAIVGGPETVAARIARLRDDHGIRYVNMLSSFFGLLPEGLLRDSLHRFATQVMPLFHGD